MKRRNLEISAVVVEIINKINKNKINKTTEENFIKIKQNSEDVIKYTNDTTIKEIIKRKGYDDNLLNDIKKSLDYHIKLNNLFLHIKENFIDKNKTFLLSDFEEYSGNNIVTTFQPIVGDDKKIKKYEALMRYEDNNKKTKFNLGETLELLTVYPNVNTGEYQYQSTLLKIIKDIGIDKKQLNNITTNLSNDLFRKNIIDSKKEYDKLTIYNKYNNNNKIISNNESPIITVNIGKSQLLRDNMFKDMNSEEMEFISKNIQFELLEYRINELDNPNEIQTTKQKNLLNNCDKINKIGCKINLDDYIDIDFFYKRIRILNKIFKERFVSIKVDGNIVKKIDLYLQLKKSSDKNFIKKLPQYITEDIFIKNYNYQKLIKYFGEKNCINSEMLIKIDKKELINFFTTNNNNKEKIEVYNLLLKDKLKTKGIEGIVEVIKLNIINSFKISKNTLYEIDNIFSNFFINNDIENLYIKLNTLKNSNSNDILLENNDSRRNIIYEYIENGELVNCLNSINKTFNKLTTEKKDISFQGFHFSSSLYLKDFDQNNKKDQKDFKLFYPKV